MRWWPLHFSFLLVLLLVLAGDANAASQVEVGLEPGEGTTEDVFELTVRVEESGTGEVETPRFERSAEFTISPSGMGTEVTIHNGEKQQVQKFTFTVELRSDLAPGEYTLPAGSVRIGGREFPIRREKLLVRKGSRSQEIDFVQVVTNLRPYVGEQITYRAEIASKANLLRAELGDVDFPGFWKESLGDQRKLARSIAGSGTRIYTLQEALFPNRTGAFELPARAAAVEREVPLARRPRRGWTVFDEVWPMLGDTPFDTVRERVKTEPLKLEVQALPDSPAGVHGYVPVGLVEVRSALDRGEVSQGEGITLTVDLVGDAYLRPYELPPTTLNGFKVYPDKPSVSTSVRDSRVYFEKRFSLALVPERAGSLEIPVYRIVTFDPESGTYQVQETIRQNVKVNATHSLAPTPPAPIDGEPPRAIGSERDLRPQREGAELYGRGPNLPVSAWWYPWFLVGVPAASLAFLLQEIICRRMHLDQRRGGSAKRALRALERDLSPDDLFSIIRSFVGERSGVRTTAALTGDELLRIAQQALGDGGVMEELKQLVAEIERAHYLGKRVERTRNSLRELIVTVDRSWGRKE